MTPPSDPNESRWDYPPIIAPAGKVRHACWSGVMLALAVLTLAFPFIHKGMTGRWLP